MTTPEEIRDLAERLAALPYMAIAYEDVLTSGATCVVAYNPQLPGCMSDGHDFSGALGNLIDARIEYISSLLEEGVSVPVPVCKAVESVSA